MLSDKTQFIFFNELSSHLKAGIPIIQAFNSIENSSAFNSKFKSSLSLIKKQLEGGSSLSEIIRSGFPSLFPQFFINLIEAGEKSGKLHDITLKISFYLQRIIKFKRRILISLLYPLILFHLAFLGPYAHLAVTRGIKYYAMFIGEKLLIVYASLALFYFCLSLLYGVRPLGLLLDSFLLKIPAFGQLIRSYSLYRFYLSFYYLFDSGIDMVSSFKKSFLLIRNRAIKNILNPVYLKIQQNCPLQDALKGSQAFPDIDSNMLITGESTGSLDDKLKDIITMYEDKIELQLQILEKVIPWIIYMAAVVFVAWQVISFYTDLYDRVFKLMK